MTKVRLTLVMAVTAAMAVSSAAAQEKPQLRTYEDYLHEVTGKQSLAIDDPMAVFAFVLGSLPDRVKVYPTENHYYFSFWLNGVRYAGNIKVDARLRAEGKIAFAYYEDRGAWLEDTAGVARVLGAADGVTVEKLEPLVYRISYGKKSVVFALNDLSQVKPPAEALAPDEQFIGPVFDDSAIRFFLVFNTKLKLFLYLLDETAPPADTFVPAPIGDGRILIGKRTGFAFYRDQPRNRKILIGVYADNVAANNHLDGPFDQMPDNFIVGDSFRDAILAAAPQFKGQINRYATFDDGARVTIESYMSYRKPQDLAVFDRCATNRSIRADVYDACFALPLEGDHGPDSRPLAMQRR